MKKKRNVWLRRVFKRALCEPEAVNWRNLLADYGRRIEQLEEKAAALKK